MSYTPDFTVYQDDILVSSESKKFIFKRLDERNVTLKKENMSKKVIPGFWKEREHQSVPSFDWKSEGGTTAHPCATARRKTDKRNSTGRLSVEKVFNIWGKTSFPVLQPLIPSETVSCTSTLWERCYRKIVIRFVCFQKFKWYRKPIPQRWEGSSDCTSQYARMAMYGYSSAAVLVAKKFHHRNNAIRNHKSVKWAHQAIKRPKVHDFYC